MGMESGSGLSVADALALQDRGNDGMFGGANGTWIWVFFLFSPGVVTALVSVTTPLRKGPSLALNSMMV